MNKKVIGYKCKNCGKEKGEHKASTFNCALKSKSKHFNQYYDDKFYEEDTTKPIYSKFKFIL